MHAALMQTVHVRYIEFIIYQSNLVVLCFLFQMIDLPV